MDLKLTNRDLDITNGELSLVSGIDAVRQDVEIKLSTWLEETPYDRSAGLPYLQVFFVRGVSVQAIRFAVQSKIESIDGVTDVLELDVELDRATRVITITGRVVALDEEFPIEVEAAAP